jgi:hypothetical protein
MARKWPLTPTEDITVKTLATHPLGPKQKLTVVQVGQEQILLGVSPDSINFLSTLNRKPEAISRTSLEMPPISKPSMPPQKREVLEAAPLRKSAPKKALATEEGPRSGGSISYGIGDDGIKNLKTTRSPQADQDSIEDVTKLIRKKLRELPKV